MTNNAVGPGASQADIRQLNRELALTAVARRGSITRASLALELGLSRPAVSRIVSELSAGGWLIESERLASLGRGRPTTLLSLPRRAHLFFGVDVRLEGILIQARDLSGQLLSETRHSLSRDDPPSIAVELISAQINTFSAEFGRRADGVGLAVGAQLDADKRIIVTSLYRPWTNVALPDLIARRLGPHTPPVVMDDVSGCAALANWQEVSHDLDVTTLAHLQIGIGAGAGLVTRRNGLAELMSSPRVAHLPMEAGGAQCPCGACGCLDAVAGFPALVRHAVPTGLQPVDGPEMIENYCAALRDLAERGDPLPSRSVEAMADIFARAAAMLINITQPSRFSYGGYPLLLGRGFHERFVATLRPHVQDLDDRLVMTDHRDRASVHGAYWLVLARSLKLYAGETI